LVDEVVAYEDRAEQTQTFLQRVLAGKQSSRRRGRVEWGDDEGAVLDRARRRIGALPPSYHEVYSAALELLIDGARQKRTYVEHQREELRYSAASALSASGKSAFAFFYLRQMAGERAAGRFADGVKPATLAFDVGDDANARLFAEDVCNRKLAWGQSPLGTVPAAIQASFAETLRADTVLYAPTYQSGGRLIELATRKDPGKGSGSADETTQLARTLQRLGFEVARTTPHDGFVSNRLLVAYLTPLACFVSAGGEAASVNGALRALGFVRRPHALLAMLDRPRLTARVAKAMGSDTTTAGASLAALDTDAYDNTIAHSVVIDALCISMLDAILTLRAQKEVRDLTIADLIARELLDFPRHLCSLCSWLKRERVAQAIANEEALRAMVPEQALGTARAFAAEGRQFYR
jgi:hypothetical protein